MNQEKIIAIIKKIREDNNLTQRKLANKLHVTYQAVSKWENGKSIPDIEMLKIISETFNIDINEFFDTKPKKHVSSLAFIITTMFIIAGVICCVLIFNNGSFNFKSANSGNIDFKITGSAAYDDDKTYIQITSVEYESDEDLLFESIKCSLYEEYDGNIKLIKDSNIEVKNINLKEYLNKVKFNVTDYQPNCDVSDSNLYIEISGVYEGKNITYKIPIIFEDICE